MDFLTHVLFVWVEITLLMFIGRADGGGKVIFAVNAGGESHIDINGVHYEKDPLKVGIASDYGKHLMAIGR